MPLAAFTFAVPVASRSSLSASPCSLKRSSFLPAPTFTTFNAKHERLVSVRRNNWLSPRAINVSPVPPGGDPIKISPIPSSDSESDTTNDPAMNGAAPDAASSATPVAASSSAPVVSTATPITIAPIPAQKPAPGAAIVPAAPSGEVATLSGPPGVFNAAVALGTTKANKSVTAIILMGIAAGAYIAIGCLMSLAITGNSPALNMANPGLSKFIFGFIGQPWGLFMVLTTGAELFTGNSMLMTAAALRGKTKWATVIAKWLLVFVANCVGALAVVWFALKSQAVTASAAAYVAALASAKVAVPWEVAFLRGIGCNWIVCVGVLAATGSRDLVGKFMAALAVVSMFVTLGFDQCIANMFFLPLGLACGGDLTVKSLIMSNIIPVTLGNIVGGALLVGMVYTVVNGGMKPSSSK